MFTCVNQFVLDGYGGHRYHVFMTAPGGAYYINVTRAQEALEGTTVRPEQLDRLGVDGLDVLRRGQSSRMLYTDLETAALALVLGVSYDWLTGAKDTPATTFTDQQLLRESVTQQRQPAQEPPNMRLANRQPNTLSSRYLVHLAQIRRRMSDTGLPAAVASLGL